MAGKPTDTMSMVQEKQGKNQSTINLQLNMEEILSTAKEGLLALGVNPGLQVLQAIPSDTEKRVSWADKKLWKSHGFDPVRGKNLREGPKYIF
ncbi:hypothetical protein ACFOUO_12035 [Salinithrix halophila]|uniref:Uncharacterized protein n=1 Tax=Salinithrix halophila TaxID=1485204 RepID=A0ABV8JHZ0_9BACL